MSDESFDEVSEILKYIMENPSVPRNIRRAADESNDDSEDPTVRASAVILKLDEISNDPNIPIHARTLIWEILSKLEARSVI